MSEASRGYGFDKLKGELEILGVAHAAELAASLVRHELVTDELLSAVSDEELEKSLSFTKGARLLFRKRWPSKAVGDGLQLWVPPHKPDVPQVRVLPVPLLRTWTQRIIRMEAPQHAEEGTGRRVFYHKPEPRQYWREDGTLVREQDDHKAAWTELFYDLIFVAAIKHLAHALEESSHAVSGTAVGQFIGVFSLIWGIWCDSTTYLNRFHADDVVHTLFFFVQMVAVFGISMSAANSGGFGGLAMILFYGLSRLTLAGLLFGVGYHQPQTRSWVAQGMIGYFVPPCIFFISYGVSGDARYALWVIAVVSDIVIRAVQPAITFLRRVFFGAKFFGYPFAIEHIAERFGLFTLIVLGEVIFAAFIDFNGSYSWRAYVGTFCGLAVPFILQINYFDMINHENRLHALHRNLVGGIVWLLIHLPLHLSMAFTSAGLVNSLTRAYAGDDQVSSNATRWMLYGGLAGCFLVLASIAGLHRPQPLVRLRVEIRIAIRAVIGIVCALVPLFGSVQSVFDVVIASGLLLISTVLEGIGTVPVTHPVHWWNDPRLPRRPTKTADGVPSAEDEANEAESGFQPPMPKVSLSGSGGGGSPAPLPLSSVRWSHDTSTRSLQDSETVLDRAPTIESHRNHYHVHDFDARLSQMHLHTPRSVNSSQSQQRPHSSMAPRSPRSPRTLLQDNFVSNLDVG